MKYFNRYSIVIIIILTASGFTLGFWAGMQWMYFLTCLAIVLALFQLSTFSRLIRKNAPSFLWTEKKNALDVAQEVFQSIELQKHELKNILLAIEEIQAGKYTQIETIQLEGSSKAAIHNLRNKLLLLKEKEAKQTWTVKGIALLGEIRKSSASLADYSYQVISTLVKYMEANQGAFYMLNPENPGQLELQSTYAYGKRKYTDGKIVVDIGSGLVGQCVLEKDIIVMTQVPEDYVKITSGLGEATPRCVIIVPLIFREQVYGVIEVASFRVFEKHQLEFLRKVSESIAAELGDALRQENTNQLLKESQKLTQHLKAREEQLRQNIEELQATQEEMKRKEKELKHMSDLQVAQEQIKNQAVELKNQLKQVLAERKKNQAILEGCVDGVISFNERGIVSFINQAGVEIFGYHKTEMLGNAITDFIDLQILNNQDDTDKFLITPQGAAISVRTELNVRDKSGNDISVLLTATKVVLEDEFLFTLFAQKISVELF
jgi:PAS domain S-box-containing protein